MNKESWYAAKLSDMDVVTISYTDDWVIDYDKSRGMYRVSYFQDNHFVDEHWFDAYEEKEVAEHASSSLSEAVDKMCKISDEEIKETMTEINNMTSEEREMFWENVIEIFKDSIRMTNGWCTEG